MKKNIILVALAFLSLAILTQCFRLAQNNHSSYSPKYRQPMTAATSAEEWLERRETDLIESYSSELSFLYAELPPQDQWEAIYPQLATPPNDLGTSDLANWKRNEKGTQEELFRALLENQAEKAELLSRKLVLSKEIHDYSRDEARNLILHLSQDPAEGIQWIEENAPILLKIKKRNYSSSKNEPEDWKKALAANQVEEGIQLLWKKSKEAAAPRDRMKALSQLLKVGKVLERRELTDQAASSFLSLVEAANSPQGAHTHKLRLYQISGLISYYADREDWLQIQSLIAIFQAKDGSGDPFSDSNDDLEALSLLVELSLTDDSSQTLPKVQKLIAEKTLPQLLEILSYSPNRKFYLGEMVLGLLEEAGEKKLAGDIALYLLAQNPSADRYYQHLFEKDQSLLESFLPRLLTYDPFEERPLIWQAEIALAKEDMPNAEKLINAAIALDPSDGDQGKETRMYCYDVLARILAKQGNQEKADFFQKVVLSIREGEAADDFLHAGLVQEATLRYKAALGKFSDAYCLQSRLAMTLAKAGRFEEAIPHFEKAFELMPVSFGPRESHCLGCEGIFDDERVQKIATRILKAFVAKNPNNPRAPYLLGMVFEEMNNTSGAIEAYQQALQLDPSYYNCANRLRTLLANDPARLGELRALQPKLLAIAPYPKLGEIYRSRTDLRQLYQDAAEVAPSPLELPPLPIQEDEQVPAQQYSDKYYNSWKHRSIGALRGWQSIELLRHNDLLGWIEELN